LVLGDIHVPARKPEIPPKFKELLALGKMQHILCTGNIGSKAIEEYLRTLSTSVTIVKGDQDTGQAFADLYESKVIKIGDFRIGLCHGHQVVPWGDKDALATLQRQLDVDILITGHTHVPEATIINGKFFLNPGSLTGAYSPFTSECHPSFILMAINGPKVQVYIYQDDPNEPEIVINKAEYTKAE